MIENTAYVALSRQTALERELDVIANNLANVSTTGFKRQSMVFREYLTDIQNAKTPLSFVIDKSTTRDFSQGAIRATGNPLDLTISGKGYLTIETDEGTFYTRNGNLRINERGELTTIDGHLVLSEGGTPIVLDSADLSPNIAADGTVSDRNGEVLGRIALVDFANEQSLEANANGFFASDEAPQEAEEATILQGYLESSNVQPVTELTRMIDLSRNYMAMHSMMERESEMRSRIINRLGRVHA